MNSYQKLQENYPTFKSTLRLDERQQTSLDSLLGYTEGALNSYRSEIAKAKADTDHSSEFKAEKLKTIKAKCVGAIATEFGYVEKRVLAAETALYNATQPVKPKNTTEELLRFMKSKEIRDSLAALPLPQRVEVVMTTAQNGEGSVLQAIKNQPITSNLMPSDVTDRANRAYAEQVAPQQVALAELAVEDLEGALGVKNLAGVEMDRIEA